MKKLFLIVLAAMMCGATMQAQTAKEIRKERQTIAKMTKSELNDKASKAARKEAKAMKKAGWLIAPGALPIDKQLDRAYQMQYEIDENLLPKYMMGEAMSTGGNYDAAKMQALELAKQNLAGQIQTEVTALIENTVANEQLDAGQAESITRSVSAAKNLISQSIGRTLTVTEVYRDTKTKGKEVLVRIAYNSDLALKAAKNAIKQDLEKKGDDLHKKLDELLGW